MPKRRNKIKNRAPLLGELFGIQVHFQRKTNQMKEFGGLKCN